MAETKCAVKFGTDGWRGIIADDFTYANVRVAAAAIAGVGAIAAGCGGGGGSERVSTRAISLAAMSW